MYHLLHSTHQVFFICPFETLEKKEEKKKDAPPPKEKTPPPKQNTVSLGGISIQPTNDPVRDNCRKLLRQSLGIGAGSQLFLKFTKVEI